jgi:peroxiredoxin
MPRRLLPIALLAAVLAAVAALQYLQRSSVTGFEAPDFALPDLRGEVHRLSDFRGRFVFLNLWTTWCPPCREEMPSMQALYREMRDRGLVMLAVSQDENGARVVVPFAEQLGLSFPILIDPEATLSPRYGVTGYPETFIIDGEGKVLEHVIGPENWMSPARLDFFHRLLSPVAPAR